MNNILKHLILLVFITWNFSWGYSQHFKFNVYGARDGLNPFIYAINQDQAGYLVIASGAGFSRYNGFSFLNEFAKMDGSSFISCLYKDENGVVWQGHNGGGISAYNGKSILEIAPDSIVGSIIKDITGDKEGNIFFASQNKGIIKVLPSGEFNMYIGVEDKILSAIMHIGDKYFILGTSEGLGFYHLDEKEKKFNLISGINQIPSTQINCIESSRNGFLIGTSEFGFYELVINTTNNKVIAYNMGELCGLQNESVQTIYQDQEGNIWIGTTGNGVFKTKWDNISREFLSKTSFHQDNGLPSNFIRDIFEDREGNIWIGTFGKGLAMLVDEAFSRFVFEENLIGSNITSLATSEEFYWIGSEKGILKKGIHDSVTVLYGTREGLPNDKITCLYLDQNHDLYAGTGKSGIYRLKQSDKFFQPVHEEKNFLENSITSLAGMKEVLWVGTRGGVFKINKKTLKKEHYSTTEGLPHNFIRQVFIDEKESVWIATRANGLYSINKDKMYKIPVKIELELTAIVQDNEGNLWAGTYGNGVYKFTRDSLLYFSSEAGLRSEYIYSMVVDREGKIWCGHRLGLSRIDPKKNAIKSFGLEVGIKGDCNPSAAVLAPGGKLLFGTTGGLVLYDPAKMKQDKELPAVNITNVWINDEPINYQENIVLPYGKYRLKIEYIGLYYHDPKEVKYQYQLLGHDPEWSEYTSRRNVTYSKVEEGNYQFLLKACTGDEQCTTSPLHVNIRIKPPFWKRYWFIITMIFTFLTGIFLFIKIRERKQIAFQKYLQEKLDERTAEVIKQKEEIEVKNRDITDSINYAQRIQSSILPSPKALHKNFDSAFIFYEPRDIVSGDFFWYDKVDDNKMIIVCADSTGHGVPGAFMSIIGTTLIKDIILKQKVTSPAAILDMLNSEVTNTLNQNKEMEKSSDGMDIIVCEVDLLTLKVNVSSAMRPYIIYQDNKQLYVKGNQVTIGGNYCEKKEFFNNEFQLSKGDLLYMFSDGYTDQFGGPIGKKLKMSRLKMLLDKVYMKPMEEQYTFIVEYFYNWKGKLPQVDDVLFMGIKF